MTGHISNKGPETLYDCPAHGLSTEDEAASCCMEHPVRVFREEDVKPLYDRLVEVAEACFDRPSAIDTMLHDTFSPPEDWK
jgi:hypothetical protein